jgi:hypothetical protein
MSGMLPATEPPICSSCQTVRGAPLTQARRADGTIADTDTDAECRTRWTLPQRGRRNQPGTMRDRHQRRDPAGMPPISLSLNRPGVNGDLAMTARVRA